MFISIEGNEGAGKSTQARLLAHTLRSMGYDVLLTREPGSTDIGDQVRAILHDPTNEELFFETEALLYASSRSQLVRQKILPALKNGSIVICDRYVDSTIAYQGYGRQYPLEKIKWLANFATDGLLPDITIWVDIPVKHGLQRILDRNGEELTRMDLQALEFHLRVRQGFMELAEEDPKRWYQVDGTQSKEIVQKNIEGIVFPNLSMKEPHWNHFFGLKIPT